MKKVAFTSLVALFCLNSYAQNIDSAFKNIKIGQSMATTDQQALPAQFTATFPQHAGAAFLFDIGISADFGFSKERHTLGLIAEYHRNTLTDSVQNNLQIGLKGTWVFCQSKDLETSLIFIYDPQLIIDKVAGNRSVASDLLMTWKNKGSGVHFGTNGVGDKGEYFLSLVWGAQVQQVYATDGTLPTGFKLRPLAIATASYALIRNGDGTDPVLKVYASYAQRITAVNTASDNEKFSHLLHTGVDYIITNKPATVSVGASFVNGSDYFTGLKQQQYFLLSLNILKK
jgi:hypothetical protein